MEIITREQLMDDGLLVIAGPCAVESREQILTIAKRLREQIGIKVMRCQLWKPRTNPDSWQGAGEEGIPWLKEVKEKTGMIISTEIVSPGQVALTKGVVDILQVGARNMQNFELLKPIGQDPRPVILKNGLSATVAEWMNSAKYCGVDKTILCERGIRGPADAMRFTEDYNSALVAKHDFGMPVIVDPSHSAGRRDMVGHLSLAAVAAGLDGLMIEVHDRPDEALCDAKQQLDIASFEKLMKRVRMVSQALNCALDMPKSEGRRVVSPGNQVTPRTDLL